MRHTLRLRLIVSILALLLPAAALAGWLLLEIFGNRLLRDLDVALEEETSTVAALLEDPQTPDGVAALVARIAAETDLGAGKQVAVFQGEHLVAEAPPGAAAALHGVDDLRVASAVTEPEDGGLTVTIGVPATAAVHATRRLRAMLLIGIPAGLLLLAAGLWALASRALRPLEDAAAAIGRVGVGDLALRLPTSGRDDEISGIVAALNRMLDRLSAAMAQMQRLTADAAHELRTPIAVLRAGLEVALRRERSPSEYRAALTDALQDSERLDSLAEDLLTLARLEGLPPRSAATAINLDEVLLELADAYEQLAERRGVRVAVDADPALNVRGTAADLYRLFANLLDNALRHAREGGAVGVRAVARDGRAEISVTDDGAGIPADELERIFDRFFRGRGEQRSGTGLGLSIARAIARAHGGDVTLDNRVEGGCVATVVLPLV
ncbi:MAG TPA: ATP-binding protein [Candidatus Dormibacteraeota bacterium]|nr:ATP-binding protein [Candidatus Dormibacteraeota bacterium]